MNQPRQCPWCKTWYAPHIEKCECMKSQSSWVTFRRGSVTIDDLQPMHRTEIWKSDGTTTMCKEWEHKFTFDADGCRNDCSKCWVSWEYTRWA